MKEIYSDGISDIFVSRGLAYLDFYHLVPDASGHHEQVPFLRLTIPMTLKGFFGMVQTGHDVLNHLIEAGRIIPVKSEPVENAAEPVAEKKPGKKGSKSAPAKKADAKPAAKPAPAPAKKAEMKPAAKPAPAKKADAKPAAKPAPAPAKKSETKPAAKPAPAKKSETKTAAKPAAKGKKTAK